MFLLNLGYKWTYATLDGLRGAVVLASSNRSPRLVRDHPGREFPALLLDPQLYLAGLRVEGREKVCARLASYPWFQVRGVQEFDSGERSRSKWEAELRELVPTVWPGSVPPDRASAVESAIAFQVRLGCTAVILPTPLLEEREDEAEMLGSWLDAGLGAADELEVAQPLLATVALSEGALNESAFESGGLLEAIIDQASARNGLDGVYIVIAHTRGVGHPFEASIQVLRAYWHLVHGFRSVSGLSHVVTNFADLGGFVALGLGATSFASGQSVALRCLSTEGFTEGGGKAMPHFYSHKTAAEYLSETDLDKILAAKLVRRVEDETDASASLMASLRAGRSASSLPDWAESQNNVTAAQRHYLLRLIAEGRRLRTTRPADRLESIVEWLESAEGNSLVARARLEKQGERCGRGVPLSEWRTILSEIADV